MSGSGSKDDERAKNVMMEERSLPWLRMPRAAVIVVVFAGFAAAMAWLFAGNDFLLSLSIFCGVAVATLIYHRRRCPKCGGSLALRRDDIEETRELRFLYDCKRCQITWCKGEGAPPATNDRTAEKTCM